MKFIDMELGLNDVSWKLLKHLTKFKPELHLIREEDNYQFDTSTWYNGRERGFCLHMFKFNNRNQHLYICWSEHRNSDDIRIFNITCKQLNGINPLKIEDLSDKDIEARFFNSSVCYPMNDLIGAGHHIMGLIKNYHNIMIVDRVISE